MIDRVGQQLGNYRLLRLLGRGGFAEVYLGEHLHLKTNAAIKVLHTSLEDDDAEEFLREAQTVARLIHPHIVKVFDYKVEAHTPFLVMDYLPNGNVRRLYPKGTQVPLMTIVSYVRQVASALQYAHEEKVIHRDIKPENMLLDQRNQVVLSDFGIALMTQSSNYQSPQKVAGTAAYMAPEQFQAKARSASDQYSLGVVVYEWLSGSHPFHGSFAEIASQHMFVPPPPLRGKIPTLSPFVEQVVLTALAKDPHQRFASVKAFAIALEQASQDPQSPTMVTPTSIFPTQSNAVASPTPTSLPMASIVPPTLPGQVSKQPGSTNSTLQSTILPTVASPLIPVEPQLPTRGRKISRRSVLVGLTALTVAGGGLAWWMGSRIPSTAVSPTPTIAVSPSPVSSPSPTATSSPTPSPVSSPSPSPTPSPTATSSPTPSPVSSPAEGTLFFTYKGHTTTVNAVAWSPGGSRIASAGYDHTVQVWNASNGGNPLTYKGHADTVYAVAWSPDSSRIASGSGDGTVQVWNASNGGNVFTYKGHTAAVNAVAWSPGGQRIASASSDHTVQVWNASNGGNVFTYKGHTDTVNTVAWSPDGSLIASGSHDNTVQIWNAANGANVFSYKGYANYVFAIAWSPDGSRIASGGSAFTVQVWQAI